MRFTNSALAVVAGALAAGIAPPRKISPVEWAKQNLIVPDGPLAGEKWSPDLTPYVVEPLEMLAPDSGVNEIVVKKGVQTGFTTLAIAAIGHRIDCDPCNIMLIEPTSAALSDFNKQKLQPAIDNSPALAKKVAPQVSRAGTGSTSDTKVFPKGFLTLAIASSAADLRSKTIKFLIRDEIDEYPADLDGQGSPLELSDGRYTSFLKSGDWKKADISTPTVKGGSNIEQRHALGDKRRWFVTCPHCRADDGGPSEFVFEFGPQFRFGAAHPYDAHYVAPCCGAIVTEIDRVGMVRGGRWIATDPRPGAFPSYHLDTLSSPFVPWDHIARLSVEAAANPVKLKSFYNLWLGLEYEVKGDAPDHELLMARREAYARGKIPPRGLMLVAAADVQMRGVWVEVLAVAPNRETWVVDALYLDGSTEAVDGEAFEKLKREVLAREYPDAFGGARRIDALGVDSGYRSHVVYAWVRANQDLHPDTGRDRILALDGRPGWGRPAIGTPSLVDINLAGQRVRQGAKVWPVGAAPLKGALYTDLHKRGVAGGATSDPAGYCHFGDWLDETYFRQITAEYLAEETTRGRVQKVWKPRPGEKDNHLLDCRVYNLALAEYLGLSATSEAEWADLARRRGMPEAAIRDDLFTVAGKAGDHAAPDEQSSASPPARPAQKNPLADALSALGDLNGG